MSFILDSLKRAEQERRRGNTPAIDTLYEDEPPPDRPRVSRRFWWGALIAANLAVVVLLGLVLLQKRPVPGEVAPSSQPKPGAAAEKVATGPPAATAPAPVAVAAASSPEKSRALPQSSPEPPVAKQAAGPAGSQTPRSPRTEVHFGPPVVAQPDDLNTTAMVAPPAIPFASKTSSDGPRAPVSAHPRPAQDTSDPTPSPLEAAVDLEMEILPPSKAARTPLPTDAAGEPDWIEVPSPHPAPESPLPPEPATVARSRPDEIPVEPSPAPSPSIEQPALAPSRTEQVPLLQETPPDVREKLKDVKISVLVYAGRQAGSMVYINSRRYQSGDRIGAEGYVLEEILPDGIILDYGEGRVKIRSGL